MNVLVRQSVFDMYNQTYTIQANEENRLKISKEDLSNLIYFAMDKGILKKEEKKNKQWFPRLKLNGEYVPCSNVVELKGENPLEVYKKHFKEK